jgi:hypothetical protein
MDMADLTGFKADLKTDIKTGTLTLTVDATREVAKLPVCLWDYSLPEAGSVTLDGINGSPATLAFLDVKKGTNRFSWKMATEKKQ